MNNYALNLSMSSNPSTPPPSPTKRMRVVPDAPSRLSEGMYESYTRKCDKDDKAEAEANAKKPRQVVSCDAPRKGAALSYTPI